MSMKLKIRQQQTCIQ